VRAFLKAVGIPLSVIPSVVLPLVLVASTEERGAAEREYRNLPALPASAEAADAGSLTELAVELADHLRAVPVDATGERTCAADALRVSYTPPGDNVRHGAHLDPLGPAPTAATQAVNGVVICATSDYGFMGFEAWRDGSEWRIAAVPFVAEGGSGHDETPGAVAEPPHVEPAVPHAPAAPPVAAPALPALDTLQGGPIEAYARYEPQRICDPAAKPGTLALRNLLLARNPGTRSLGISRNCGAGGTSEHKEGRALDWGVLATRPNEAAAAERFVGQLMAADAEGHRHALARRMGVMYVIWNRRIWSAYRPEQGWRAYSGPSPHTDHVHVSLSWAGATGRTSFWSGKVDPAALLASAPVASTVSGGSGAAPKRHVARRLPKALPTGALRAELGGRAARGAIDPATGTLDPARLPADWRARWDQMTPEQQAEVRRRMEERAERRRGGGHRGQRHGEHDDGTDETRTDERQSQAAEPQEAPRESRAEERAAREQARAQRHAQREAERQAERQRREAARAAAEEAHREANTEQRTEQRAEHEAQRPERRRRDGEHDQERDEARQRAHAERQAQRQAAREAEQQRRAEAREQRHAERREQATVQQGDDERRGGHGRGRGEGRGRGHHRRD